MDRHLLDKDREKLYREYITKLKTSDLDRKKDFNTVLKSLPAEDWRTAESVPDKIEKDIRFYGIRDEKTREELVAVYSSILR